MTDLLCYPTFHPRWRQNLPRSVKVALTFSSWGGLRVRVGRSSAEWASPADGSLEGQTWTSVPLSANHRGFSALMCLSTNNYSVFIVIILYILLCIMVNTFLRLFDPLRSTLVHSQFTYFYPNFMNAKLKHDPGPHNWSGGTIFKRRRSDSRAHTFSHNANLHIHQTSCLSIPQLCLFPLCYSVRGLFPSSEFALYYLPLCLWSYYSHFHLCLSKFSFFFSKLSFWGDSL